MKKLFATLSIATLLFTTSSMGQTKAVAETTASYPQGKAYENGGYQEGAGMPVVGNWSYNLPFKGTETNKLKWNYDLKGKSIANTPTVDKDGNIYYVSWDGELVSLNKKGELRFTKTYDTSLIKESSAVIGFDDVLYLSGGKYIYAINLDGSLKWKSNVQSGLSFNQTPAIGKDGTIYVMEFINKKLYAFNKDGSVKWISDGVPTSIADNRSPLVSKDGTIYVEIDNYIVAFDSNGKLKWKKPFNIYMGSLNLLEDGRLIYSNRDSQGHVKIINQQGEVEKDIVLKNAYAGRFAIVSSYNGELIVHNRTELTSYKLDGTVNWTYQTEGEVQTKPIIDSNGVIYFGSDTGITTALNPNGTVKWEYNTKNDFSYVNGIGFAVSPISFGVDKNGTLYTQIFIDGVASKKLIAIGDDSTTEEDNMCKGYLEEVEQKIKDGSITKEEINVAQLRLSKAMYDLSQKENQ